MSVRVCSCCGYTLFECLIAFHVDIRCSIWQSLSIAFVHNLYLVDLLLYTERVFENLQWVKKYILHYPCFWFLGIWKIDAIFIFEHVISWLNKMETINLWHTISSPLYLCHFDFDFFFFFLMLKNWISLWYWFHINSYVD